MSYRVSFSALFSLLITSICLGSDIEKVINQTIVSRNKIESYHMVMVWSSETIESGKQTYFRKQRLEIWRQGDKARIDSVVLSTTVDEGKLGKRQIHCKNCEKQGQMLMASYWEGGSTPVTFHPISSVAEGADPTTVNWPWLGLSNNVVWPWIRSPQENFLRSFLIADSAIVKPLLSVDDEIEGRACRRFTIQAVKGSSSANLWTDPARGNSPIKLESMENGKLIRSTLLTYPAKEIDKIWFPTTVVQKMERGQRIDTTTYTIEKAEFNRRISDKVFEYSGLDLPDNFAVETEPGMNLMKLPRLHDGKLIYPEDKISGSVLPSSFSAVPDKMPVSWLSRVSYMIGAFVLALVGVSLARRFARNRAR